MSDVEDKPDFRYERHPVYLNPHCIALVQLFKSTDSLYDLWVLDYVDHITDIRTAARQFLKQIEDECSVRFLQELREACADQIRESNTKYGNNHSLDPKNE